MHLPVHEKEWNTSVNIGPEANRAIEAIRKGWGCPARFSVREQRWKPKMSTAQDEAMNLMAQAWARHRAGGKTGSSIPFYKIGSSTLRSLRSRGWVESLLPKLTHLGIAAVQEFWPYYLRSKVEDEEDDFSTMGTD